MSLTVKEPERIPPIEGGTYQGICYSLIDIGTHHSDLYNKDIQQVVITWEVPEARIDVEEDGKTVNRPRVISRTYTQSLSEKAKLYADLVSWRGASFTQEELDSFDLRNILGKNCILTIINETNQKGKLTAKIATVAKLMKTMKPLEPENPIVSFDMDADGVTNIPDNIPDWLKDQIKNSIEHKAVTHAQGSNKLAEAQKATGMQSDDVVEPAEGNDLPF